MSYMSYEAQYRFLWAIKRVFIFLQYNRHLQGPKVNRFPAIGWYGFYGTYRLSILINRLIEKNFGPQGGWGWEGSELDGVDPNEYVARKEKLLKRQKGKV